MMWLIPVAIAGAVIGKIEYDKYHKEKKPITPAPPPWLKPPTGVVFTDPPKPEPFIPPAAPPAVDYTKVAPHWTDTAIGKQGATVESTMASIPAIPSIYNNPAGGASAINPTVKDTLNQWAITVSFHDPEMPLPLDGNYDKKTQAVMALFQAYSNDPLAQDYYKHNAPPSALGIDVMDGLWMGPSGTDFDRHAGSQLVGWGSGIQGGSYQDGGGGSILSAAKNIMKSTLVRKE